MKNIHIIILIFQIFSLAVYSEKDVPYQILSPEAATITKFGNNPVSLYTGTPQIEVPLYNIKELNTVFPIKINYDASGVLPNKDAGIVGQNWMLCCGGQITRQARGVPDDCFEYPHLIQDYITLGSEYYSYQKYGYWAGIKEFHEYSSLKDTSYLINVNNYFKLHPEHKVMYFDLEQEYEPDIFTIQIFDKTFRFIIGNNGIPKLIGNKGLKIDLSGLSVQRKGADIQPSIIKVVLDDGYQYEFGGGLSKLEVTYPSTINNGHYVINTKQGVINSWYLTRITTPDNQIITFNYMSQNDPLPSDMDNNCIKKTISLLQDKGFTECYWNFNPESPYGISTNYGFSFTKLAYLSEINTPLGKIKLNYSVANHNTYGTLNPIATQFCTKQGSAACSFQTDFNLKNYKLDSLVVSDKMDNRIKKVEFNYEIVVNEYEQNLITANNNSSRLFLSGLKMNDTEKYLFDYNKRNMAHPLVATIDMEGFYNGTNLGVLLSLNNNPCYPDFQHRQTDTTYSSAGVLTKIIYPSGGYSQFCYEPHTYSCLIKRDVEGQIPFTGCSVLDNYEQNFYVGGPRIQKIVQSTGEETVYSYQNGNLRDLTPKSSGIYCMSYTNEISYSSNSGCNTKSTVSSNNLYTLATIPETRIGYSQVTEEKRIRNRSMGKTTSYFTSYKTKPDIYKLSEQSYKADFGNEAYHYNMYGQMNLLMTYSSNQLERGLLTKKEYYNSDNVVIRREYYDYNKDPNRYNDRVIGTVVSLSGGNGMGVANAYATYCYDNSLSCINSVTYINSDSISDSICYTYNSKGLLRSKKRINSNNISHLTTFKYPDDFNFNYYNGQPHPFQQMQMKNMINYPIEQKTFLNNLLSRANITLYMSDQPSTTNGKIKPSAIYKLDVNNPISDFTPVSSGDGNTAYTIDPRMNQEMTYTYYPDGNIKESYSPKTNVYTTYLWSYLGQYPVAEVQNVTWNQVQGALGEMFLSSLSVAEEPSANDLNRLAMIKEYFQSAMVTTYTYKPLVGMTSKTDPRGVTTYYEYDNFNRLKEVYIMENGVKKVLEHYSYKYKTN